MAIEFNQTFYLIDIIDDVGGIGDTGRGSD